MLLTLGDQKDDRGETLEVAHRSGRDYVCTDAKECARISLERERSKIRQRNGTGWTDGWMDGSRAVRVVLLFYCALAEMMRS